MSSQFKKLDCAILLDPSSSDSDKYALEYLQSWYKKARATNDTDAMLALSKGNFHRDVYLAGLYLYMLDKNLCKSVANSVSTDRANLRTLQHVFSSFGFEMGSGEYQASGVVRIPSDQINEIKQAISPADPGQVSEALAPLLQSQQASLDDIQSVFKQQERMMDKSQQTLTEVKEENRALKEEIASLKAALSSQGQTQSGTSGQELDELKQLLQSQGRQLNKLAASLKGAHLSVVDNAAGDEPEDLEATLENIKRVKQKGIW